MTERLDDQGHGDKPRESYEPLTEERVEEMRTEIKGAATTLWIESNVRNRWHGELDRLCNMAVNALEYAQEIERLRTRSAGTRIARRQYYYLVTACKANFSQDPDCICWHDEGTGPLSVEEQKDAGSWRETPVLAPHTPTVKVHRHFLAWHLAVAGRCTLEDAYLAGFRKANETEYARSATEPLKTHYHRGGVSAEKCPLCLTDADKQLGISICQRWPVDLADVQGIIEFVRANGAMSAEDVEALTELYFEHNRMRVAFLHKMQDSVQPLDLKVEQDARRALDKIKPKENATDATTDRNVTK